MGKSSRGCTQQIAFFHLPKTGGRSFQDYMRDILVKSLGVDTGQAFGISESWWGSTTELSVPLMSKDDRHPYLVGFHTRQMPATNAVSILHASACRALSAILLREPTHHVVSLFSYGKRAKWYSNVSDVVEFSRKYHNPQSRYLVTPLCSQNLRSDAGAGQPCDPITEAQRRRNLALLRSIDIVGIVEDIGSFASKVLQR